MRPILTEFMIILEFRIPNLWNYIVYKGISINDVPRFLAIFDLPTYLVLL